VDVADLASTMLVDMVVMAIVFAFVVDISVVDAAVAFRVLNVVAVVLESASKSDVVTKGLVATSASYLYVAFAVDDGITLTDLTEVDDDVVVTVAAMLVHAVLMMLLLASLSSIQWL
jgi:hypothetical protein